MNRAMRWMVVAGIGIAAFVVTWWLAESVFGVDRGTAQAVAGLVFGLVTIPAGWWFALDPPPSPEPAHTTNQPRSGRPVVIGVVVLALIVLAGVLYHDSPHGPAGAGSTAKAQTATVDKTVWYRGLKVTVGQVSYDPTADPQVTAQVRLANEAWADLDPYIVRIYLRTGTQYFPGAIVETNPVLAQTTSDYHAAFAVNQLSGALTDAALVFGDGTQVQSIVPLGGGPLVANQPQTVLSDRDVAFHDLKLHIDDCQLRADFLQNARQTGKGDYVLGCSFEVSLPGGGIHWFDVRNVELQLPDGTAVSSAEPPDELMTDSTVHAHVYAGFTFAWPMPGRYVLQVLDPQSDVTDAYDLPFTVQAPQ